MIAIQKLKGSVYKVYDTDNPDDGYETNSKTDAIRFAEIFAQISEITFNDRYDLMVDLNKQLFPPRKRRKK